MIFPDRVRRILYLRYTALLSAYSRCMGMTGTVVGGFAVAVLLWRIAETLELSGAVSPVMTGWRRWRTLAWVSALTMISAAAMAQMMPARPAASAFVMFAAVTPGLAWIDVRSMLLPFPLLGGLALAAVAGFSIDAWRFGSGQSLERALACGLVVAVLGWVCWRSVKDQVGLGDVALLGVTSLFLGWWSAAAVWLAVVVACLLWWVTMAMFRLGRTSTGSYIPLGPAILGGWWTATALVVAGGM
ncbi:hypothetical protein LO763_11665 [Glycomyces sp. A-F 0318]|uniref:prepilin peptidase n=1 Tax=Glycomyces amatae TaxID=2881355 RepID=UPI001E61D5B5|nr:prepilin peptidase [Glycomyces amatae]MCD0444279.1 hypothetical protein [Glycomyces amatae]